MEYTVTFGTGSMVRGGTYRHFRYKFFIWTSLGAAAAACPGGVKEDEEEAIGYIALLYVSHITERTRLDYGTTT